MYVCVYKLAHQSVIPLSFYDVIVASQHVVLPVVADRRALLPWYELYLELSMYRQEELSKAALFKAGGNDLRNLTNLRLDGANLLVVSEALRQCVNLSKLEMRNNFIAEIPCQICSLTNLEELNLGSNMIGAFPDTTARVHFRFWFSVFCVWQRCVS